MRLMNYAETTWLSDLGNTLDEPDLTGHFKSRFKLQGRNWLSSLPPEERKKFSTLGHLAQSYRGTNWHSLGGIARADAARRDRRGRFVAA